MSLSEVMTIVIAFHGSVYRTFKEFYTLQVQPHWKRAFPNKFSYNRFVELMPWSMMLLCCFLQTRKGEIVLLANKLPLLYFGKFEMLPSLPEIGGKVLS